MRTTEKPLVLAACSKESSSLNPRLIHRLRCFKVALMAMTLFALVACGGGGRGAPESVPDSNLDPIIDPTTDANGLSAVLITPNTTVIAGSLPGSSDDVNQPKITRSETNVSYSAGGQIVLPIDYQGNNGGDVAQILYSVKGSDNYTQIDTAGAGSSGTITVPINIPANVSDGSFCLDVRLVDSNGLVSANQEICINVTQPLSCDTTNISGGEGLTSTLHEMDGTTGGILVEYQTFTVKDKIDVFQDGVWLGGTGPLTKREDIRTALDCSVATEDQGYVGEESAFLFHFDPSPGGDVEVVVSGCENGGTAWEYTASCPGGTSGVYDFLGNSNSKVVFSQVNSSYYLFSQYFVAGGFCEKTGNETYVIGSDGQVQVSIADDEGLEQYSIPESQFTSFLNTEFSNNYVQSNEPLPASCFEGPSFTPITGANPIPDYIIGTWTFTSDGDTYYFDIRKTDENSAQLVGYFYNDANPSSICYLIESESTFTVDADGNFIEDGRWDVEINQSSPDTLQLPDYWLIPIDMVRVSPPNFSALCGN